MLSQKNHMTPASWRLIVSEALPGAYNMALDEALFEMVARAESPPILRFYRWEQPTVSLGYGQEAATGANLQFCRRTGLPVVRRMTGGRAVLHAHELTYSLIAPERNSLFPGTIRGNYSVVAEILREAIETFGLRVEMFPGNGHHVSRGGPEPGRNVCFSSPSIHELVVAGCKITGSAQLRRQGFFLQHGSIPIEVDLDMIVRALTPSCGTSLAVEKDYLYRKVGWLNRFSPQPVDVTRLCEQIIAAFTRRLKIDLIRCDVTAGENERAWQLRREKYDNPLWNLRRQGKTQEPRKESL